MKLLKQVSAALLMLIMILGSQQAIGQKVKTKPITYRGITMKVPNTAPDFNSQEPSASLKVSDDIMIHFRIMPNMVSTEQAAKEHGDQYWETLPKERGIPMQMELDGVSYYFVSGLDAKGEENSLLAGATAHDEYYGIYIVYGDPASAKLSKKTVRSIRAAKEAPQAYEAPAMEMQTVTFGELSFEVPAQVQVKEPGDGIALVFDNMYMATLTKVKVAEERNEIGDKGFSDIIVRSDKRVGSGTAFTLAEGWQRALICYKNAGKTGAIFVDDRGKYVGTEQGNLIYTELKSGIPELKSYAGGIHRGSDEEGYVLNLNVMSEPGQKFAQDLLSALSK